MIQAAVLMPCGASGQQLFCAEAQMDRNYILLYGRILPVDEEVIIYYDD
jgi:hypothetical protein